MTESLLQASVVMPTHGRRASLMKVLEALGRQSVTAGTFEVVVICDGDVDGSAAACRALAPVLPYTLRVFVQANQGPAAARNRGVEEACAPLIIFLDDDVVPDDRLIATHLAAHKHQALRVTIGPLLPPAAFRLSTWTAWEVKSLLWQYDDMATGRWSATYRQFYTGNAAVLKQHIVDAGGFDSAFRRAEDVELALRLRDRGLHFVFLPEARGWHYVRRPFESWLRIPAAYGSADVAMARARQPELLTTIAEEYHTRSRAVRAITHLCVGRPAAANTAVALLSLIVRVAASTRVTLLGHMACSLIFNLRYYDGLACALGGRSAFAELLRGQDIAALLQRVNEPKRATIH